MSTEENLDEFLNLLEDECADKEETSFHEEVKENSPKKDLNKLTYEDVFGSPSPEKKRRKVDSGVSGATWNYGDEESSLKNETFGGGNVKRNLYGSDVSTKPPRISGGLDTNGYVIDYFSKIRLYKTSIALYCDDSMSSESVLKERNMGLQYVSLMSMNLWFRTKKGDEKNIWTSGVLVRKQPIRKSSKGNEYLIWEVNDLKELEKCWTVYLFSGAASSSSLNAVPIGSLIDLTSPSVMDGKSNNGTLKLSVNNHNQIRLIGTSKDFGYCRSKRKDGKDCTAIVNKWECDVCIYHASSELKKLNYKKNKSGVSFADKPKFNSGGYSEPQQDGVISVNFGKPVGAKPSLGFGIKQSGGSGMSKGKAEAVPATQSFIPAGLKNLRMELQGTSVCNELKRNTLSTGNSTSINFKQEKHVLLTKELPQAGPSKPLSLDPMKTRHLTERDREILTKLHGSKDKDKPVAKKEDCSKEVKDKTVAKKGDCSKELATQIIQNPSAGSLNLMKYLSKPEKYTNGSDQYSTRKTEAEPLRIDRKTLSSMKKALDYVKTKGPIQKADPNAIKKKVVPTSSEASVNKTASSKSKPKIEVEFDFESEDFKQILNAKSAHEETVNDLKEEEYFQKLTMKEAIENKLLNTFSVPTTAAMCRQCKYVAVSQSDYCKEQGHQIRIVKATKRFFKCKDCGNRTMSLDRLPKRPCKICNSSSWLAAPLGKEKKGPVLPSEVLAIRGNEEKFIGSAGSKLFLNLEG